MLQNNEFSLLGGSMIASLDEKGNWIYKANESHIFKKSGALKAKYADLPRFKVINQYEDKFKKDYSDSILNASKEMMQYLSTLK